jgi:hypothetical protein
MEKIKEEDSDQFSTLKEQWDKLPSLNIIVKDNNIDDSESSPHKLTGVGNKTPIIDSKGSKIVNTKFSLTRFHT